MIFPKPLSKGDTVSLFAPARAITLSELSDTISILESWGLNVKLPELLFEKQDQFAGNTKYRAVQVQSVLDDSEIKAMIAVRGGYGCSKIIDLLDFSEFKKYPKWLVGFSDLTVFLGEMFNLGLSCVHGPVALLLGQKGGEESASSLRELLFNENPQIRLESRKPRFHRAGNVVGELVGGNLSVLVNQIGTSTFPKLHGKILFVEDLDEYLYHIDRMMTQLSRLNSFRKLKGLVVGHMSDMNDNVIPFGKDAEEIIRDIMTHYEIPYATGFSIGHQPNNYPVIIGQKMRLQVDSEKAVLTNKSI